jgi:hypothetical protein
MINTGMIARIKDAIPRREYFFKSERGRSFILKSLFILFVQVKNSRMVLVKATKAFSE